MQVIQLRMGSQEDHETFKGLKGEITINTTDWSLIIHDGLGGQYKIPSTEITNEEEQEPIKS